MPVFALPRNHRAGEGSQAEPAQTLAESIWPFVPRKHQEAIPPPEGLNSLAWKRHPGRALATHRTGNWETFISIHWTGTLLLEERRLSRQGRTLLGTDSTKGACRRRGCPVGAQLRSFQAYALEAESGHGD